MEPRVVIWCDKWSCGVLKLVRRFESVRGWPFACVLFFFFVFATYLLCLVLTAGSVSHVERGDGENRHPAHQGSRKSHEGTGNIKAKLKSHLLCCLQCLLLIFLKRFTWRRISKMNDGRRINSARLHKRLQSHHPIFILIPEMFHT